MSKKKKEIHRLTDRHRSYSGVFIKIIRPYYMGVKKHNWRNVGVLFIRPNPSGITGVTMFKKNKYNQTGT